MKEHSAFNALGSYAPPPNKLPPPPPVRCNALLGGVTLTLQPHSAVGRPAGDVAYMRMPLSLGAMASLEKFISAAYGKDCVCTEDPKGWLKVSTPNVGGEGREPTGGSRTSPPHCSVYLRLKKSLTRFMMWLRLSPIPKKLGFSSKASMSSDVR
jgi:hypothetical protein